MYTIFVTLCLGHTCTLKVIQKISYFAKIGKAATPCLPAKQLANLASLYLCVSFLPGLF